MVYFVWILDFLVYKKDKRQDYETSFKRNKDKKRFNKKRRS